MSDVRESVVPVVMPGLVRAAQLLLFALGFIGLVMVLALSGSLSSYGLGALVGAWLPAWICALLALTYGGGARGGVRITTIVLMVFTVVPSARRLLGAGEATEFLDAALRVALGAPVVVLLFLRESTAWFDRER
ncbi:hypothetical protein K4B79_25725 [Streptomyces lincolnensis]|uniref:hypothetical protein n=1 Tax=Streptomyces lincolnensis TaxID=1915 RepID=UPI001E45192B|nr:hypothetical protein [Streptomyces lincolnensis]MCD7441610.1 hypothetical protein [Streptomyces lincolnensis]